MARKNPRRKTKPQSSVEHLRPQGQVRTHRWVGKAAVILVSSVFVLHSLAGLAVFADRWLVRQPANC